MFSAVSTATRSELFEGADSAAVCCIFCETYRARRAITSDIGSVDNVASMKQLQTILPSLKLVVIDGATHVGDQGTARSPGICDCHSRLHRGSQRIVTIAGPRADRLAADGRLAVAADACHQIRNRSIIGR